MSPEVKSRQSNLELRVADRERVFEKLFSKSAREGFDVIRVDEVQHIPGYYEQYPDLSHETIDEIVDKNQRLAGEARMAIYAGAILEGDLRRANVAEKIKQERNTNVRKQLEKELKHVKKGIKQLSKDL